MEDLFLWFFAGMLGEDLLSTIAEKNKKTLFFHLFCLCFTFIFLIFAIVDILVLLKFDQKIDFKMTSLIALVGGGFFSILLYFKARYTEKNQDEK